MERWVVWLLRMIDNNHRWNRPVCLKSTQLSCLITLYSEHVKWREISIPILLDSHSGPVQCLQCPWEQERDCCMCVCLKGWWSFCKMCFHWLFQNLRVCLCVISFLNVCACGCLMHLTPVPMMLCVLSLPSLTPAHTLKPAPHTSLQFGNI